jgi:hypothetical protein
MIDVLNLALLYFGGTLTRFGRTGLISAGHATLGRCRPSGAYPLSDG